MRVNPRYALAAFSLGVLAYVVGTMPFGHRGYHFVPEAVAEVGAGADAGARYELSKLRLLTRCVGYIRSYYVEPERFSPREMFVSALEAVQVVAPPVLVKSHRDAEELPVAVDVTVYGESRRFELSGVGDLYQMNWKLLDVFAFIERRLRKSERVAEIEYAAVGGMLSTLDPHSLMLSPDVYREMKLGTKGEFGGLGIVLSVRDGKLTVISVIDDTPAARAGLQRGDHIARVGAESTVNMPLNEAVSKLRGEPGTKVTLWIAREGWAEPRDFAVERAIVTIRSAEGRALGREVGYIRIKHFQQNTLRELRVELERLRTSGHARGLILDLRDNPGGLLDQAIQVSDAFLPGGTIVTTVGAGGTLREEKRASSADTLTEIPVVVLVNGGSASASEIVAGALKNNGRALVIGDRTFGKGSVQVLYDIDEGALKLTIAQYLTPGDESIQSVGIVPDVQTVPVTIDADKVDLFLTDAGSRMEKDLPKHLEHTSARQGERPTLLIRYLEDEPTEEHEEGFRHDKAVRLAERLLTVAEAPGRDALLAVARGLFEEQARAEDARIQKELASLGVDWRLRPRTAPPASSPPRLRAELALAVPGDGHPAGEDLEIVARVRNEGSEPLYRIHGITRSSYARFDDVEFVFGRLRPGESKEWRVTVPVAQAALSRWAELRLDLFADGAPTGASATASVPLRASLRPHFAFHARVFDEAGNGDGRIQRGERFSVRLDVRNEGRGLMREGLASVTNRSGEGLFIHKGRSVLDEIVPEGWAVAWFDLELKPEFAGEEVSLELRVRDTKLRHEIQYMLTLPVGLPSTGGAAPAEGLWRATAPASVFPAPDPASPPYASLRAGGVVRAEARVDDFLRVTLGERDHGWVRAADLQAVATGATGAPLAERFAPYAVPLVADGAGGGAPLRTDEAEVFFEAEVYFPPAAPSERRLVYVFRGEEKVYFAEPVVGQEGAQRVPVRFLLDLAPGENRISVFARVGEQPSMRRTLFIYRSGEALAPVGEVR